MLKSWRFWCAQGLVLLIAVAHEILEGAGILQGMGMLYYMPLTFFWVPVILMSYAYGVRGSIVTASWVILVSIPNWFILHKGFSRLGEISLVLVVAMTAFIVGRLVDQKISAQRRAKEYAAYSVLRQEETLRGLSLDLHDRSTQDLIAACRSLDDVSLHHSGSGELAEIRSLLKGVIRQLRNVSRDLHPSILDDLGVVSAIRRHLADLAARTGIEQNLKVKGEEYRLSSAIELHIFRIAQEALRNVERHSGAKNIAVEIHFSPRGVKLVIADDGAGFDEAGSRNGLRKDGHFGIMGMLERAEMVGGKLDIKSKSGSGTRISAFFPGKDLDEDSTEGAGNVDRLVEM